MLVLLPGRKRKVSGMNCSPRQYNHSSQGCSSSYVWFFSPSFSISMYLYDLAGGMTRTPIPLHVIELVLGYLPSKLEKAVLIDTPVDNLRANRIHPCFPPPTPDDLINFSCFAYWCFGTGILQWPGSSDSSKVNDESISPPSTRTSKSTEPRVSGMRNTDSQMGH